MAVTAFSLLPSIQGRWPGKQQAVPLVGGMAECHCGGVRIGDRMRLIAMLGVTVGLLMAGQAAARGLDGCIALYDAGKHAAAAGCFREQALAGDPAAQNWLSLLYVRGHGVGRDRAAAAAWTRTTAVDTGCPGCPQEVL